MDELTGDHDGPVTGAGQMTSGAPARGERVARHNRLTEIEAQTPGLRYGLA